MSSYTFGTELDGIAEKSSYSFGYEFDDVAKYYAKYRPVYPPEIYEKIMAYMNKAPFGRTNGSRMVVDVGCGSGQHTRAIARYFDKVIGVDSSEAQINEARRLNDAEPNDKIVYHVGTAEDLSSVVGERSVDMVTAATALHWFDRERFSAESLRVLKVGGVFAILSNTVPTWENAEASRVIHELMFGTFKKYYQYGAFPDFDKIYREHFTKMQFYLEDCVLDCSIKLSFHHSMREILGYIKSFPQYNYYKVDHPEHPDEVDHVFKKLMNIYKPSSIDTKVDVASTSTWLLLGRKLSKVHQ